jgi:hypothetical protein
MQPSPNKSHQRIAGKFLMKMGNLIENYDNCEVIFWLDWIISHNTVVRPGVIIISGKFEDDF